MFLHRPPFFYLSPQCVWFALGLFLFFPLFFRWLGSCSCGVLFVPLAVASFVSVVVVSGVFSFSAVRSAFLALAVSCLADCSSEMACLFPSDSCSGTSVGFRCFLLDLLCLLPLCDAPGFDLVFLFLLRPAADCCFVPEVFLLPAAIG